MMLREDAVNGHRLALELEDELQDRPTIMHLLEVTNNGTQSEADTKLRLCGEVLDVNRLSLSILVEVGLVKTLGRRRHWNGEVIQKSSDADALKLGFISQKPLFKSRLKQFEKELDTLRKLSKPSTGKDKLKCFQIYETIQSEKEFSEIEEILTKLPKEKVHTLEIMLYKSVQKEKVGAYECLTKDEILQIADIVTASLRQSTNETNAIGRGEQEDTPTGDETGQGYFNENIHQISLLIRNLKPKLQEKCQKEILDIELEMYKLFQREEPLDLVGQNSNNSGPRLTKSLEIPIASHASSPNPKVVHSGEDEMPEKQGTHAVTVESSGGLGEAAYEGVKEIIMTLLGGLVDAVNEHMKFLVALIEVETMISADKESPVYIHIFRAAVKYITRTIGVMGKYMYFLRNNINFSLKSSSRRIYSLIGLNIDIK